MRIRERYKLLFKWEGIRYENDIAFFAKAWFEGPVLKIAAPVASDNFMDLDFTKQNEQSGLFLPKHYYIARLRWKEVTYKDNKVWLSNCALMHNRAGTLRNIKKSHYFVIDCSAHEEYFHRKTLVYPALVIKEDNQPI